MESTELVGSGGIDTQLKGGDKELRLERKWVKDIKEISPRFILSEKRQEAIYIGDQNE